MVFNKTLKETKYNWKMTNEDENQSELSDSMTSDDDRIDSI